MVIDLPRVHWALPERILSVDRAGVARVRFGQFRTDTSRIVIDLAAPLAVRQAQLLTPDSGQGAAAHRLTLDLLPPPPSAPPGALSVTDLRVVRHGDGTRVELDLTEPVNFEVFTLAHPRRVVIDLPRVHWALPEHTLAMEDRAGVARVRFGQFRTDTSRIVIDLAAPLAVRQARLLTPDSGQGAVHRLTLDLRPVSASAFLAAVRPADPPPLLRWKPPPTPGRRLIVLDPGHGGRDTGARSSSGEQEKTVALTFARELRTVLEGSGRYGVVMTRDSDRKVRLWRRVAIAREAEADLFLSIHADHLDQHRVRGASVYTLSHDASDAETAALARRENKADIVAGIDLSEGYNEDIATVLISMAQQDTMNCSRALAARLLPALGRVTPLVKRSHRFADFRVLKAPDIPSVLVELGFLSNSEDVKRLTDKDHRSALAAAILDALDHYFREPC